MCVVGWYFQLPFDNSKVFEITPKLLYLQQLRRVTKNDTIYVSVLYCRQYDRYGLVQGSLSQAQGGKFQHGFFSAAFTAGLAPGIMDKFNSKGGRVLASSIVGGTASVLGGGKFANGAITGAYVMLFNEMMHPEGAEKKQPKKGDKWEENSPTIIQGEKEILVVQNSTEKYVDLMDRDLKNEFDQKYRQKYRAQRITPLDDFGALDVVMAAYAAGISPFSTTPPYIIIPASLPSDVFSASQRAQLRKIETRLKWLHKYEIIK